MSQPLFCLALVATLAGCPSDDANPAVLWLALDGAETRVRLVDEEPRPY
jgi:hypothetical protein